MRKIRLALMPAVVLVAAVAAGSSGAQAQCNTIGGKGTAWDAEGAKFQAYEAMLQGTDWGMWAAWMASGAKVGDAPGYSVKGLRFRCGKGGVGAECHGRATFCKKT
ncbi:MAG TPA: hypothetical protein VG900_08730 [Hyphomicrobiaceae bacterium]|jgi:hypothetical protein|nr:hypothetical protein [Hyphomicrobiaceae bacterium]